MDRINRKNLEKNENKISIILCILSIIVYIIGIMIPKFNVVLIAIIILWLNNIINAILHIKDKIYFLFFNLTFALFLISRPLISCLSFKGWWVNNFDDTMFGLNGMWIAEWGLFIGSKLFDFFNKKVCLKRKEKKSSFFVKNKMQIAFVSFYIVMLSCLANLYVEGQKVISMIGKSYIEFYTQGSIDVPIIISVLAGMFNVSICVYLLTFPKKKLSYFVLILYVLKSIPMLLIGERGNFVCAIIFSFLYLFYRNTQDDNTEKWLGKFEKWLVIICIPIMLVGLGAYNYIRDKKDIPNINPISIVMDFFYNQGTSFDTLCKFHGLYNRKLISSYNKNYTFGGFIDYIKYENAFSSIILGREGLGNGNTEQKALVGNNLACAISYFCDKDYYLKGHGWGSSFIIETYVDYGYLGIAVYSILMGLFLCFIIKIFNFRNFLSLYIMVSTMKVFMVPRAEATGFLQDIIQLHFWIPIIVISMLVILLKKFTKLNNKIESMMQKINDKI